MNTIKLTKRKRLTLNKKQVLNFVKYVAHREKRKLTEPNLKVWSIYLEDFEMKKVLEANGS